MSLLIATESGLSCIDAGSGNLTKSYKQCENTPYGLALLKSQASAYSVLSLQREKPLFHHYHIKKEGVFKRIILPEKMSVISVSPCEQWMAAGSPKGNIYVWSMASGALKTLAADAHFQPVTCLAWTRDSSVLVSGGADARVQLWRLADLLRPQTSSGQSSVEPKHIWACHNLPISSIVIGSGSFREARLYTASEDATVTVIDLFSGAVLYTLAADTKIHSIALDPAERAVYLGGEDGLHMVPLYFEPPDSNKIVAAGSIEGSVISINDIARVFKTECPVVTAVCLSKDAAYAYVGCEDGSVSSWAVGSGQQVKKFRSTKGKATQIIYFEGGIGSNDTVDELPVLQRTVEDECLDFVSKSQGVPHYLRHAKEQLEVSEAELDEIDSYQGSGASTSKDDSGKLDASNGVDQRDLQAELEELQERHSELKKMYDAQWALRSQK